MNNLSELNTVIGEILNAKKIEHYKFKNILRNEELCELFSHMISLVEYVHNVLIKTEISQTYVYNSIITLLEKVKQFVNLEELYISKVVNLKS